MMKILSNARMEEEVMKDRRRSNLKNWMKRNGVKSIAELMRRAGRSGSSSHLQDVLSEKKPKPFGEKLARALEKELGMDPGELDKPTKAVTLKQAREMLPFGLSRADYDGLNPEQRQRIEDTIRGMLIGFSGGSHPKKKDWNG